MSSEESANYSDAQSSFVLESSPQAISSDEYEEHTTPQQRPKHRASTSQFIRSESLFLTVLFGVIALLLPAFFYFASTSSTTKNPLSNTVETRSSPLATFAPYIPTVSAVFRIVFSAIHLLVRPFLTFLSIVLAIVSPLLFVLNVMLQALLVWPYKLVMGFVRFFYPLYVFCGVACLLGAGVGVGGRVLVEGGKMLFTDVPRHSKDKKGKKKLW